MIATIILFPSERARRPMTTAQRSAMLARRIDLSNVATNPNAAAQSRADAVIELINTSGNPEQADLWREYGEHLLVDLKGGAA